MVYLKLSIVIVFSFFTMSSMTAQYMWVENSSCTNNIAFNSIAKGTFTNNEINPETNGINSNTKVSKFVRDGEEGPRIRFDLNKPIMVLCH